LSLSFAVTLTGEKAWSLIKRLTVLAMVMLATVWACDYIAVRFRIPRGRDPFGTVTVSPYYAVPQKNKTTEFYFLNPQTRTCVHSLFPHLGYPPCWYLDRRKEKPLKV
jgi:hypothetical protein